jgi:hypothetical protein
MRGTFLLAVIMLLPHAARAQEREEPLIAKLAETFRSEELTLGVLLQTVADVQIERTLPGSSGFSIANFRLLLHGQLDGGFGYWLQANFVNSPAILDAMMSYRVSRSFAFDAGQFKTPFSYEFLTLASSIDFVNRSQAVTALAPGRQIGLQARFNDRSRTVAAQVGAFNGNGTRPNGNDNNNLLYAGRVVVTPRLSTDEGDRRLVVGVNAAYSEDDGSTFGDGFVTDFVGARTHVGGDVRFQFDRWLLSGELLYAALRPTVGIARDPWGFHATAGYSFTPKMQALLRFDGFQPDDGGERRDVIILGFNAWPTSVTEFQINYLIDTRDAAVDHHQTLVNFQFGF